MTRRKPRRERIADAAYMAAVAGALAYEVAWACAIMGATALLHGACLVADWTWHRTTRERR